MFFLTLVLLLTFNAIRLRTDLASPAVRRKDKKPVSLGGRLWGRNAEIS